MKLSFRSIQEIQNAFAFVNKRLNRVISGDIPISSSSTSSEGVLIPYSTAVSFVNLYSYTAPVKLSESVEFTIDSIGKVPGGVTTLRVVGDGSSDISFSGIKVHASSLDFDTRDNYLNILVFFYDGINYWVNIFQEKDAGQVDIIAPSLLSATIPDAYRDRIVLVFDEALGNTEQIDISNFSVSQNTISGLGVSGDTITLQMASDYEYEDTVTFSYSGFSIVDTDGNISEGINDYEITNNIAAPDLTAPILQSATVSNATPTKVVLAYNETLNPSIVPSASDYSISGKTIISVNVTGANVEAVVSVAFAYGDSIAISYTASTNKVQDMSGNFAANLVNQSVTNNIASSSQIVAWENLVNASGSTNAGFLTTTGTLPSGGRGTVAINTANNFEVFAQLTSLSPATVLSLDRDSTNAYNWGASQSFEAGVYYVTGTLYWAVNGTVANTLGATSLPLWVKLRKSGNNIVLSTCATENGSYSDVKTFSGALSGVSTLYIHVLFAANANGDRIQVKYIN